MLFPFLQEAKRTGLLQGRKLKWCGLGALLVLVSVAAGMGVQYIIGARSFARLSDVLRLTDAPNDRLITAVQQHAEELAACGSEATRRELLWQLLSELIHRGLFEQVESVVDEAMPPQKPQDAEWARRTLQIAHAFVKEGKWDKAQGYYDAAQGTFQALGLSAEYAAVVRERAALLSMGSGGSRSERVAALHNLLTSLSGQDAPGLATELHVFLAKLQRSMGEHLHSQELLRKCIEQPAPPSHQPTLLICLGYAHLALREDEAAVDCLRDGLKLLSGSDASSRLYRALALRDLASVALNLGHAQSALALLERVDAEASAVISPTTLFRAEITGKRAWALYMAHDYEDALAVFQRQLDMIPDTEEGLRIHPLEGMSRCYLALGQPAEASQAAAECCKLYEKYNAEDKEGLGRFYLLSAQAQDQSGHPAAAEEMYGRAAACLPATHRLRLVALEGQASVLQQSNRWVEAVGVWEQVLVQIPQEQTANREEVQEQIAFCRSRITPPAPVVQPPAKAAKPQPSARARKNVRADSKPARRTNSKTRRKR